MRLIQFMSKTIDDFRNFFAPNKEKTAFCVEDSIGTVLGIVSAQFQNSEIDVAFQPTPKTQLIGYEGEFQQVILNILTNAKDAMLQTNPAQKKINI